MIEKIISLKNIGRFVDVTAHRGDVSFRRLMLIYGENGRGKTTLCSILRSLQTKNSALIDERKTLGSKNDAGCTIKVGGSIYKFSNGIWDTFYSQIAVFDSDFVHRNVYAGDSVEHQHKKNLFEVIIGEKGVEHNKKIDELNKKIKGLNDSIKFRIKEVEQYIPEGVSFDKFMKLQYIENFDEKIRTAENELNQIQAKIKESESIKEKSNFSPFLLPVLPNNFEDTLEKSFENIDESAGEKLKTHISNNMLSPNEHWLSQGVSLIKGELCPFCGQSIKDSIQISAYRSYFNIEYKKLKDDVANLEKNIKIAIGEREMFKIQRIFSDNSSLLDFWKKYIEQFDLPYLSFEEIHITYSTLLEICLKLTKKKRENPLDAISLNNEYKNIQRLILEHKKSVNVYNDIVSELNNKISEFKKKLPTEIDEKNVQQKLNDLNTVKNRFEMTTVKAIETYGDAIKEKAELEKQKENEKDALNKYCIDILQKYEKKINEYLSHFNAGFSIVKTKHIYSGGSPSYHYELKINNTPIGLEKFKTIMSSGDRNSLAFAFFLASLDHDSDLSSKIVVLDDPFTSLDRFRRECTAQLSQKLSEKAKQVIILSHEPSFLKSVYDKNKHNSKETKTLQIIRNGGGSVISEWDIESDLKSSYMKDFSILLGYYLDLTGNKTAVARSMRPFLEGFYRSHFPRHFEDNDWLGDFIKKVRDADDSSGLFHAKPELQEIESINEYSKKYHHDKNPNADSEIINEDELHGFTKRTLALVGGI